MIMAHIEGVLKSRKSVDVKPRKYFRGRQLTVCNSKSNHDKCQKDNSYIPKLKECSDIIKFVRRLMGRTSVVAFCSSRFGRQVEESSV